MAKNRRRSNGAEQLRPARFSGVAFTGASGIHKEVLAMTKDSNSIRLNDSVQAACVNLTIPYKGRAVAEVQF
jgi:hypothetical protein